MTDGHAKFDFSDNELKKPWLDFYKPLVLSDVVGNSDALKIIKKAMEGKNRNLLLHGPPGSGKTSSLNCIKQDYVMLGLGSFLELNASERRKNDDVINMIKPFVESKANVLKVVILDEVDNMTHIAQKNLAIIISANSLDDCKIKCIFVAACNNLENVHPALKSCFISVKFEPLSVDDIEEQLLRIALGRRITFSKTQENLNDFSLGRESLWKTIATISCGDMRVAINTLQACFDYARSLGSFTQIDDQKYVELTDFHLESVCTSPSLRLCDKMIGLVFNNEKGEIGKMCYELVESGYSIYEIVKMIVSRINNTITESSTVLGCYPDLAQSEKLILMNELSLSLGSLMIRFSLGCVSTLQLQQALLNAANGISLTKKKLENSERTGKLFTTITS